MLYLRPVFRNAARQEAEVAVYFLREISGMDFSRPTTQDFISSIFHYQFPIPSL